MFIITDVKELALWITDSPFNKRSGIWHFYNSREDYDWDLSYYKDMYGSKFMFTLKRIQELYKQRGYRDEE